MNNNEIITILDEIIENYLTGKCNRLESVDKLISKINPEEIYNLKSSLLIQDCYFAIKHLTEKKFETTNAELVYLKDCIRGIRTYNVDEKNRFILQEGKNKL